LLSCIFIVGGFSSLELPEMNTLANYKNGVNLLKCYILIPRHRTCDPSDPDFFLYIHFKCSLVRKKNKHNMFISFILHASNEISQSQCYHVLAHVAYPITLKGKMYDSMLPCFRICIAFYVPERSML